MRSSFAVVVGIALSGASVAAEARVPRSQRFASPLATACTLLQEQADSIVATLVMVDLPGLGGWTLQGLQDLGAVGAAWDDLCAAQFGSIFRDAPAPPVPTLFDGDGDLLFDEDELVYGLAPGSVDTDRDGLDDGIDPSWLADLLDGLGETRLAAMAIEAETDVRAGHLADAAELLAQVQDALGGCEPDPVTLERTGIEACGAARTLEVHLAPR